MHTLLLILSGTIMVLQNLSSMSGCPIVRLDACSESEVHFTCTVDRTELQWEIAFSRGPETSSILQRYFSSDMIIGSRRDLTTNRATTYSFDLISTSPLTSTMTANVSRDLSGAMVICQDGFTETALKDTITVHEPASPGNLTVVTSTQTTDPSDPYLNVVLQWDHQQLLNQNYTITISPSTADSVAIYNTFNTFIQLALLYDQDYNISVVAKSCIGNSMPEKIRIRIVDNCRLIRNGILTDNCLPEITITTLIMTDEMMANISINDSTSDLGSQQHGAIDPLVPSIILSHLLLSTFVFIAGIFVGCLLHRHHVSKKTKQGTSSPPEPVYTEISLAANEAYGKINP